MNQNKEKINPEKSQDLLPWYAKGILSTDEITSVETQLAESEQLREELVIINKQIVLIQNYVDGLDTQVFENNTIRLNTLKNRIKIQMMEDKMNSEKVKPKIQKKSLWQKMLGLLPQTQTQRQWQTVAVLSLAIMMIQGV